MNIGDPLLEQSLHQEVLDIYIYICMKECLFLALLK